MLLRAPCGLTWVTLAPCARARAWSRTRYLQTAGALSFAGFLLLGGGYWAGASRPGNGAPHDFLQQCATSLRQDTTTGRTFCAVEIAMP